MFQDNVLTNVTRDLKTGLNLSMQAVLATSASGIYAITVTIPDTVSSLRTYSSLAHRIAFAETPAAISTASFVVGAIVNASEWSSFGLANGLTRTVQITTASTGNVFLDVY
jgi:hypothetical protein